MQKKDKLPRIAHYDLQFVIEPNSSFFSVQGMIKIEDKTNIDCSELEMLLYHQLKVIEIKDANNNKLSFAQKKVPLTDADNYYVNYIILKLNAGMKGSESIDLYIKYEGSIDGYSHLMPYVKDKIRTDFSIIRPDCHAYPIISKPCYENIYKSYENRFTYNLLINVPKDYLVGCGGVLKEIIHKTTRSIFRYISDSPTWRFDIGIAPYILILDNDINLKIFAFPQHRNNAENIVKNEIKKTIKLFTDLFGDFKENNHFTVIEIKESYGSQAGDNYIMMEEHAFIGDSKDLTHLYHEIGHGWNVKAKLDVQRTRFFDEAFASYFEALAIREFYGDKAYRDKMEFYREYFLKDVEKDQINFDTPVCDYGKSHIGYNSYTKGPWVLYVLHESVGDEIFYKIIKSLLSNYSDSEVDFKDLEKVISQIAGINVKLFLAEWIYGIESSKYLYERTSISAIIEKIR